MAQQVPWNKVIYDEFVLLGNLNEFEQRLLKDRMLGKTISWQSMEYNVSEATISRTIKKLKVVYDKVQPHSDKLPPRRFSVKETYMDTH